MTPLVLKAADTRYPAFLRESLGTDRRLVTAPLAARRNELVAALAEEVWFAHIAPGGENQRLAHSIAAHD